MEVHVERGVEEERKRKRRGKRKEKKRDKRKGLVGFKQLNVVVLVLCSLASVAAESIL